MPLDFTKPLRRIGDPDLEVRYGLKMPEPCDDHLLIHKRLGDDFWFQDVGDAEYLSQFYENVPVRTERWANLYGYCFAERLSSSKEEAGILASPSRIACIKITYEDDKPVAAELVPLEDK